MRSRLWRGRGRPTKATKRMLLPHFCLNGGTVSCDVGGGPECHTITRSPPPRGRLDRRALPRRRAADQLDQGLAGSRPLARDRRAVQRSGRRRPSSDTWPIGRLCDRRLRPEATGQPHSNAPPGRDRQRQCACSVGDTIALVLALRAEPASRRRQWLWRIFFSALVKRSGATRPVPWLQFVDSYITETQVWSWV
jgi:hypothetical protein